MNQFNQILGEAVEDWKPSLFPSRRDILTGIHCALDPTSVEKCSKDLYDALLLDNAGESWTYLPYGPFSSLEDFQTMLTQLSNSADVVLYVIIDLNLKKPVGLAAYLRINPSCGSIEVGHLHFSKFLKKSTAATEAMYLMMR